MGMKMQMEPTGELADGGVSSEGGDNDYTAPDLFGTDFGETLPPQTPVKAVEKIAKAISKRTVAPINWNTKWDKARNIRQLLSKGLQIHADDLGLVFLEDGYVKAQDFIDALKKVVPQTLELQAVDLKTAIMGTDTKQVRSDASGSNTIHQFDTFHDELYVRCVEGHLSKYYGDGPGLIKPRSIFQVLGRNDFSVSPFHDTKMGNIGGINSAGLISNASAGSRFVHLWLNDWGRLGRVEQDVIYKVNAIAAIDAGIVFYKAANGVVLVETCIPSKYLTCTVNIRQEVPDNYAPFYDACGNTDALLMDFALDVVSGMEIDVSMGKLWCVLRPTVIQRLDSLKPADSVKYKKKFGAALEKNEHNVRLNIKFSYNETLKVYLLMINGKSDFDLIKLGKKYGFPRGCPVLWNPGQYVDVRGFYPKFENDENEKDTESAFKDSVLDEALSLYFFKKWSGFLLHIIGFKVSSKLYWTVCSKKSADPSSPFVIRGCNLIETVLKDNTALLTVLADEHLYLGGEALHSEDEHGYIAKQNAVVITCVGKGTFYTVGNPTTRADFTGFVGYYSSAEVVKFCNTHKLLCDSSYTLTGGVVSLKTVVNDLLIDRDLIRNETFEQFIASQGAHVQKTSGSADHFELVGDVLEGFVFHITTHSGEKKTVKVKLPFYTWRTMFLREWLNTILEPGSTSVEGKCYVTADCAARIESFVRRWCFTPSGKTLFTKLLKSAAVKLQTQWPLILSGWAGGAIANRVHVIIADTVENVYFSSGGGDLIDRDAADFDRMLDVAKHGVGEFPDDVIACETVPVTICICVGPIGSGKSTFMDRLYSTDPSRYEVVDGDMVVGKGIGLTDKESNALTYSLKGERNPTTWSRVWEAVMKGKIPLISHGGGSFIKFGRRDDPPVCKVVERVQQVFGVETNLVVVLMRDSSAESPSTKNLIQPLDTADFESIISRVYSDPDQAYMTKVYANRSEAGVWDKIGKAPARAQYVAGMSKTSLGNARCALAIANVGSSVFTAPFQPGSIQDWKKSIETSDGLDTLSCVLSGNIPRPGFFQQMRAVLVEQNGPGGGDVEDAVCKHVTLEINTDGFECTSSHISQLIESLEGKEFTGIRYMMTFHSRGSEPSDISILSATKFPDLKLKPQREMNAHPDCRTVSVVHMPALVDFCNTGKTPHVTEKVDELPAKDSVKVIEYFQKHLVDREPLVLNHKTKGDFVFDGPQQSITLYETMTNSGKVIGQRPVVVSANYVDGTESVTFKCIGVTVFGHEDAV